MWGKASLQVKDKKIVRITPTHVGKRQISSVMTISEWDHPHPCGEKFVDVSKKGMILGSPPPMWGKVGCELQGSGTGRITPTHVGKRLNKS